MVTFVSLAVPFDSLHFGFMRIKRGGLTSVAQSLIGFSIFSSCFRKSQKLYIFLFLHCVPAVNSDAQFVYGWLGFMSMESEIRIACAYVCIYAYICI